MDKFYVVEYTRHNAKTNAWAYKSELGTTDKDEAEKKAHAIFSEYIGGDFDCLNVIMHDEKGNIKANLKWPEVAE